MENTILEQVKLQLGVVEDEVFDLQIIDYINTAFFTLNQLGIGPDEPFSIRDGTETWSDFSEDPVVEPAKIYVSLYVRSLFDAPSSYILENIRKEMDRLEFRMMVECEKTKTDEADMTGIYILSDDED